MTNQRIALSRRGFVKRVGALAVAGMAPAVVRGQGAPMQLGVLTPLTGAGGFDGPRMLKAMQGVIDEVNAAGGLL
ncbi:MAG: twin-arginine translocation signal domain-containing protein, partial [Betaproteobacteria bacterium]